MSKIVACILRNTGSGWFVLNDSAHAPIGVSGISQDASAVTLNFDFTAGKINTLLIAPDETYAQSGHVAGASVGTNHALIKFGQNGAAKSPSQVANALGNFWVYGLFDAQQSSEPPPVDPPDPPTGTSQTFTASGQFVVPTYASFLTVELWGGGGGGFGDANGQAGQDGGSTAFQGLAASGGKKGHVNSGTGGGDGGAASGGDINTQGQRGGDGTTGAPSGKGGDAPNGGLGGAARTNAAGLPGEVPGAGGSGGNNGSGTSASGGGSGGYVHKVYALGALTPGAQLPVVVAAGGPGGVGNFRGGDGARGEARFTWDVAP